MLCAYKPADSFSINSMLDKTQSIIFNFITTYTEIAKKTYTHNIQKSNIYAVQQDT